MQDAHAEPQKEKRFLHIGMRKVKSLLAVLASFFLWQLVRLPFPGLEVHPIYMYIYSLIEVRDTSEKTVSFGKRRIKATFVAFSVGLPTLALTEILQAQLSLPWAHEAVEIGLILLGVLLSISLAQKVGCQNFCGLAAAIFIILVVSHGDDERYIYCVLRAAQTIAGVLVAWLINVKLLPYPRKPKEEPMTEKTV